MNLFNPMENEWMGRMANDAQAALERERLAKEEEKKRRQADAFIRQMIGQRDAEGGAPQGLYSRFPGISETMGAKQAQPAPLPERTAAIQREPEIRSMLTPEQRADAEQGIDQGATVGPPPRYIPPPDLRTNVYAPAISGEQEPKTPPANIYEDRTLHPKYYNSRYSTPDDWTSGEAFRGNRFGQPEDMSDEEVKAQIREQSHALRGLSEPTPKPTGIEIDPETGFPVDPQEAEYYMNPQPGQGEIPRISEIDVVKLANAFNTHFLQRGYGTFDALMYQLPNDVVNSFFDLWPIKEHVVAAEKWFGTEEEREAGVEGMRRQWQGLLPSAPPPDWSKPEELPYNVAGFAGGLAEGLLETQALFGLMNRGGFPIPTGGGPQVDPRTGLLPTNAPFIPTTPPHPLTTSKNLWLNPGVADAMKWQLSDTARSALLTPGNIGERIGAAAESFTPGRVARNVMAGMDIPLIAESMKIHSIGGPAVSMAALYEFYKGTGLSNEDAAFETAQTLIMGGKPVIGPRLKGLAEQKFGGGTDAAAFDQRGPRIKQDFQALRKSGATDKATDLDRAAKRFPLFRAAADEVRAKERGEEPMFQRGKEPWDWMSDSGAKENDWQYIDSSHKTVQQLQRIPIEKLPTTEGNRIYVETVDKYKKQPGDKYPVVYQDSKTGEYVVDDGNHRIRAAAEMGEKDALVWVRKGLTGGKPNPALDAPRFTMGEQRPAPRTLQEAKEIAGSLFKSNAKEGHRALNALIDAGVGWDVALEKVVDLGGQYLMDPKAITDATQRRIIGEWLDPHTAKTPHVTAPEQKLITEADILNRLDFDEHADTIKEVYKNEGDRAANFLVDLLNADIETVDTHVGSGKIIVQVGDVSADNADRLIKAGAEFVQVEGAPNLKYIVIPESATVPKLASQFQDDMGYERLPAEKANPKVISRDAFQSLISSPSPKMEQRPAAIGRANADELRASLEPIVEQKFPRLKGRMTVVQRDADLDPDVRAALRKAGMPQDGYRAFAYKGRVYFVGDNIQSHKAAQEATLEGYLRHEGRHVAIREMFGGDTHGHDAFMTQAAKLYDSEVRDFMNKWNIEDTPRSRIKAAEEVLVEQIKRGKTGRLIDAFIARFRGWARKVFPGLELSKAEARAMIARADRILEDDAPVILGGARQPAFMAKAHHGTPHTFQPEPGFPHGRFRLDKIGTGEGGQAYGHGIYLADQEMTGEKYRENLIESRVVPVNVLREYYRPGKIIKDSYGYDKVISFNENKHGWSVTVIGVNADGTEKLGERERTHSTTPEHKKVEEALQIKLGSLYKVEIPDEDMPRLLDWDKPLSEQSEYVKKALKRVGFPLDNRTGGEFYTALSRPMSKPGGSKIGASQYLASIGIPGHQFLDQGSRIEPKDPYMDKDGERWVVYEADGQREHWFDSEETAKKFMSGLPKANRPPRTHNYVIWDQDLLDRTALLERNYKALDQRMEDQPGADANSLIKQAQAAVDKGKTMAEKQRALDEWKAQNPEAAREVEGEGRVYRAVGQAEMDTIVRTGQVKSALTMALPIERALGLTAVGDSVRDVGMYADINRQGGGKALILEMTPSEDMRTDWASLPKMLSERAELRQETANLKETMRRKGPEWENAERFRDWIASNEKRLEELDKTMGNTDFSGVNVDSLPRGVNLPYRQTPKAIAADRITAVYEQDAQGALKDVTQDVLGRPSRPSPLTLRPDGTLAGMEQRPAASSPAQPEFQRKEAAPDESMGFFDRLGAAAAKGTGLSMGLPTIPEGEAPKGGKPRPKILDLFTKTPVLDTEGKPTDTTLRRFPIEQMKVSEIAYRLPSGEAPIEQFKKFNLRPGDNEEAQRRGFTDYEDALKQYQEHGVLYSLGEFSEFPARPITVFEYKDGKRIVGTGRHRRYSALRTEGTDKVPVQVFKEADGWTLADMKALDAITNIQDEKGDVQDFFEFFSNTRVSEAEAKKMGLLASADGRRAWTLAEILGGDEGGKSYLAQHMPGKPLGIDDWKQAGDIVMTAEKVYQERVKDGKEADRDWLHMALHALYKDNPRVPYRDALMFARNAGTRVEAGFLDVKGEQQDLFEVDAMRDWKTLQIERNKRVMQRRNTLDATRQGLITKLQIIKKISPDSIPSDYTVPTEGGQTSVRNAQLEDAVKEEIKDPGYVKNIIEQIEAAKIERQRLENYEQHKDIVDRIDAEIKADIDVNKSKFAAQEAERKAAFEQIQEEMKRRKEHKKLSDEPKPEPDATGDMFGEGEKPAAEKPAEPAAPKAMPRNLVRVPFGPDIEDKGFTRAEHREAVRAALLDFREQKNPSDPETILSMDDFGETTVSPNKIKVHGMSKAAYKQIHESEYGPIEHIAPELFHDQPWRLQYSDRAVIGDKATEDEHIAQVVEALWRGVPDPDNPGKRQFLSVEDYNRVFNSEWNEPDMGNAPFAARAYGDPLEFLKAHGRDMRTAPPSNKTDGRKNLSDVIHGLNSAALDQRSFTRFWSANGKAIGETPPQEVIDGVRAKAEALKTLSGKLSRASKGAGLLREQNAIAADKHYFDKAIADGLISEDIARKVQAVLADTVIRNSAALNRAYGMYGPSGDPGDQTAKALKILGDIQPVAGVDFDTVVAPGEAKGYYGDLLASAQKQAGDDTKWQYSEWKKTAVDFESVTANVARKTGLKQIYTSGVMLTKSRLLYDQWKSATDRKWMELTAGMKFDRMTPDEKQACIDAFTTGDLQKAPEAVRPVVQFLMDLEKSEIHKLKFNRMFSYIYDYTDDAMGRAKMESHFNEDVLAWLDGTGLRELYKEDPISAIAEALRLSVSPESDALKITNYYPAKHESTSLASDIDWELQGGPDYGKAIEGVSHEKSRMAKTPRQMAGDENPLNKMMSHYRTVNARFYMRAAANTFWSMVEPNIETTSRRASLEGMREKINAIAAPRTPLTDMEKIARHIGSMAYVPRALGSAFKNMVGLQHNMSREQFPTEGIFLIRSVEDFQKRLADLGIERSEEDIIREYTQSASIQELLTAFQIEREMDTHEMSATARALARFGKPGYGPGLDLARNAALAVLDAAEYALARGRGDPDVQDIRVTQALDDMLDHPLVSPANYLYHKLGTKMGAMMGAADTFNRTNDGFGYIRGFKRMHDRLAADGRDTIEIFNEMYAKGIFVKMNDAQRLYIADLMRTGDIGEAAWEYGRINTTVDNGEYRPYLASLWGGKQGLRTLTPYLTYARLNTYKVARLLDSTARDFTKWAKTGDVDAGRAFAHDMKGMSIYVAMGAIASAFTVGVTGKWGKPGVFSSDDPDEDGIVRKMLNASTEYQMNANATLLSWGLNAYRNMRKYGRTTSHAGEVMFDYIAGVKQAQDVILLGLDKAGMQTMTQEEYEKAWERITKSQRRFSYDWMAGYAQLERTWGSLIGDPDFNAYKFAAAKLGADIEPYSEKYPHHSKNPFVYPMGALTGWGEYIEKPKKPQYGPRKRYSRNSNAAMPSMGEQMPTMPGQ